MERGVAFDTKQNTFRTGRRAILQRENGKVK